MHLFLKQATLGAIFSEMAPLNLRSKTEAAASGAAAAYFVLEQLLKMSGSYILMASGPNLETAGLFIIAV